MYYSHITNIQIVMQICLNLHLFDITPAPKVFVEEQCCFSVLQMFFHCIECFKYLKFVLSSSKIAHVFILAAILNRQTQSCILLKIIELTVFRHKLTCETVYLVPLTHIVIHDIYRL